jgi:hypothetical protein
VARKKKGFGKFLGSLTGSAYDRTIRQIDKVVEETEPDGLGRQLNGLVRSVRGFFDEGNISAGEHDLLLEAIEEVHPEGTIFPKLESDDDEFYDETNMPDAPELELGGPVNLDELMSSSKEGQGSWGSDEYDDYKRKMAEEFYRDSDDAIASGDHGRMRSQDPGHRVYHDVEEEAESVKRAILEERGDEVPAEEVVEDHYFDDDGVEWWKDDDGQWWYRPEGEQDWSPWDE